MSWCSGPARETALRSRPSQPSGRETKVSVVLIHQGPSVAQENYEATVRKLTGGKSRLESAKSERAWVEISITLEALRDESAASSRTRSKPLSAPGSISTNVTSGFSSFTRRQASAPVDATPTTLIPSRSSSSRAAVRKRSLSSIIRHRKDIRKACQCRSRTALQLAGISRRCKVEQRAARAKERAAAKQVAPTNSGNRRTTRSSSLSPRRASSSTDRSLARSRARAELSRTTGAALAGYGALGEGSEPAES